MRDDPGSDLESCPADDFGSCLEEGLAADVFGSMADNDFASKPIEAKIFGSNPASILGSSPKLASIFGSSPANNFGSSPIAASCFGSRPDIFGSVAIDDISFGSRAANVL